MSEDRTLHCLQDSHLKVGGIFGGVMFQLKLRVAAITTSLVPTFDAVGVPYALKLDDVNTLLTDDVSVLSNPAAAAESVTVVTDTTNVLPAVIELMVTADVLTAAAAAICRPLVGLIVDEELEDKVAGIVGEKVVWVATAGENVGSVVGMSVYGAAVGEPLGMKLGYEVTGEDVGLELGAKVVGEKVGLMVNGRSVVVEDTVEGEGVEGVEVNGIALVGNSVLGKLVVGDCVVGGMVVGVVVGLAVGVVVVG
eukprot:gene6482-7772_t